MAALAVASGTVGYGNPTCLNTTTDVGQVSIPAASSLLPPRGNRNPLVVTALAGASTSSTGYAPRGPQLTTRATEAATPTGSFAPSTKPELLKPHKIWKAILNVGRPWHASTIHCDTPGPQALETNA